MTPEKVQEIYEEIFDLTKILEMKSEGELDDVLKEHVFCDGAKEPEAAPVYNNDKSEKLEPAKPAKRTRKEPEQEDDIPMGDDKPAKAKEEPTKKSTDEKIKNLLDGLDNL
jgi:hypothetical protein